jgi:hypothetical protein
MKGVAGQGRGGWRLPAAEMERIVAVAAKGILDDKKLIVCAIEEGGVVDSSQIGSILDNAAAWSTRLLCEPETGPALASLVDRVELKPDGIRLLIRLPISPEGTVTERSTHLSITREIPMQLRRWGVEKRVVIETDGGVSAKVDEVLLKAVARALLVRRAGNWPLGLDGGDCQAGRRRQAIRQPADAFGLSRARARRADCRRPPTARAHGSVIAHQPRRSTALLGSAKAGARMRVAGLKRGPNLRPKVRTSLFVLHCDSPPGRTRQPQGPAFPRS